MGRRVVAHIHGNAIAYLALFFALTGVAYAAGPLKSGDPAGGDLTGSYPSPQIAPNAVGSAEVANNSLTGDDVNESTLAKVPSAVSADSAATATSATTATSADSATTAGDAENLDGHDSTDFLSGYERVTGDSVFVLPGDSPIAEATATCPEGKLPVGGGFETGGLDFTDPNTFVIHSQPVYVHKAQVEQFFDFDDLEFKNGFIAKVQFQDPPTQGEQRSVTASVICVTASAESTP